MMPMYEFLCGSCEKDFETILASARGVDLVECPECGSGEVHKKLSLFANKSSSGAAASTPAFNGYAGGGGCCGGGCACH